MMRYFLLTLGTVLSILFIAFLKKGKKYEYLVENLDSNEFPLNELYTVGFVWSTTRIFCLKGKVASELKTEATLLYDSQYAEYYANIIWAQTLTLVYFFLTMTFLCAGIMYSMAGFMLIVGGFLSVLIGVYCMENMKNMLDKRTRECENELPEVVSTMAVLVNSGMMLRESWDMIAENGTGEFYRLMQNASKKMQNGISDADAIFLFGKESNSAEIKKFTSALLQNMEKGGTELAGFLTRQSSELWSAKRQKMLQEGEKAATKLLMPIVLIFIGIIIIVITAAFAGALF